MDRMKELVEKLNKAADAYYNTDTEIMSNYEYDQLFDELSVLEKETGTVLPNSPTQRVGYQVVDGLKKVEHEHPALSLNKTKDINEMKSFVGDKDAVISWKMDGLTVVVTYDDGKLKEAVTRGNGYIGEDITHNAKFFNGLPQNIPNRNRIIIRGEAVIKYSEFERINATLEEQYKNPRNLASGTVRALDNKVCKDRQVDFYAFQVVKGINNNSFSERLDAIKANGIQTVDYERCNSNTLESSIRKFESMISDNDFPTDGLVIEYDDVEYGESLGSTGHHPRYGMAFKWADEIVESTIIDVEWSASRTGLLNPVAVFEPVEIEGTMVSRASIHNVSIAEGLNLHKGDRVGVYKANMIIPQIAENYGQKKELSDSSSDSNNTDNNTNNNADNNINLSADNTGQLSFFGSELSSNDTVKNTTKNTVKASDKYTDNTALLPPKTCPVCGSETKISNKNGIKTLMCTNPDCAAKHIGQFERFVDRDAMNIDGLSTATIEDFISKGFIKNPKDLYDLEKYRSEIIEMDGYGEKSYKKIIDAVNKSRTTTFERFLYSLGISNIGRSQSKEIKKYLQTEDVNTFLSLHKEYLASQNVDCTTLWSKFNGLLAMKILFSTIDGLGEVMNQQIYEWYNNKPEWVEELASLLTFENEEAKQIADNWMNGKTFVITGNVNHFANRNELKAFIEENGGKVTGSVTKNTDYLVNNDINSTSSKNKKAKELNIPIISEDKFIA